MSDVDRARKCEAHLRTALDALAVVRAEVQHAGESYPDDYAEPVYADLLKKTDLLRAYLEALTVPARAYRGETT